MAITACAAKVSASSICLSVNASTKAAHQHQHTDWLSFAKQRNTKGCVHVLEARNVRYLEFWDRPWCLRFEQLYPRENAATNRSSLRFGAGSGYSLTYSWFWRIAVVREVVELIIPGELIDALSAWHNCAPDLTNVSNTAFKSNVERLITLSTSPVAASRSRASAS